MFYILYKEFVYVFYWFIFCYYNCYIFWFSGFVYIEFLIVYLDQLVEVESFGVEVWVVKIVIQDLFVLKFGYLWKESNQRLINYEVFFQVLNIVRFFDCYFILFCGLNFVEIFLFVY